MIINIVILLCFQSYTESDNNHEMCMPFIEFILSFRELLLNSLKLLSCPLIIKYKNKCSHLYEICCVLCFKCLLECFARAMHRTYIYEFNIYPL